MRPSHLAGAVLVVALLAVPSRTYGGVDPRSDPVRPAVGAAASSR